MTHERYSFFLLISDNDSNYCIQPNIQTVCLKKIGPWKNVKESVVVKAHKNVFFLTIR